MATPEITAAERHCAKVASDTKLEHDYYKGNQRIVFSSTKGTNPWREIIDSCQYNLCGRVVDATVDRLRITGIVPTEQKYTPLAEVAWDLWQDSRGELRATNAFTEAEISESAYFVAWPDANGKPRFYEHDGDTVYVKKSTETGETVHAVLFWTDDDNKPRLTIYRPDVIEEYRKNGSRNEWDLVAEPEINPFGFVPVYQLDGQRGLRAAVPLQDKLNKSVYNQWVAGEVFGQPFRAITGLEIEFEEVTDENGNIITRKKEIKPEANRFATIFGNEDVKFHQLPPSDPSVYTAEQDATAQAISRVTATPSHLLSTGSTPPSGEALKVAEASFVSKVRRRQTVYGAELGRMFTDAVRMSYILAGLAAPDDLVLEVQWAPAGTQPEKDPYEAAVLMQTLGVPLAVILTDVLGYSPERASEIAEAAAAARAGTDPVSLFNAGNDPLE